MFNIKKKKSTVDQKSSLNKLAQQISISNKQHLNDEDIENNNISSNNISNSLQELNIDEYNDNIDKKKEGRGMQLMKKSMQIFIKKELQLEDDGEEGAGEVLQEQVYLQLMEEKKEKLKKKILLESDLKGWQIIIYFIFDVYTSTNSLMQLWVKDHYKIYMTYSISTIFRVGFWFYISLQVSPTTRACIRRYFWADDLFVASVLTIIAYTFQNESSNSELVWRVIADISLIFLLMIYDGCLRCLVDFYHWTKKRQKIFKFLLFYAIMINMVLGSIGSDDKLNNYNKDFFLLYRFSYLAHLCIAISMVNSIDMSGEHELEEQLRNQENPLSILENDNNPQQQLLEISQQ